MLNFESRASANQAEKHPIFTRYSHSVYFFFCSCQVLDQPNLGGLVNLFEIVGQVHQPSTSPQDKVLEHLSGVDRKLAGDVPHQLQQQPFPYFSTSWRCPCFPCHFGHFLVTAQAGEVRRAWLGSSRELGILVRRLARFPTGSRFLGPRRSLL